MTPFPTLIEEWKSVARFPGWSDPEPETGYIWFDSELEIGGVTEQSFVLHGGCYHDRPDLNVTFELRVGRSGSTGRIPLVRMDWRSLNGSHSNPRKGNSIWRGKMVSDTHLHAFELNWLPDERRMRGGNLRLAREIDEALQTFDEVREFVGKQFRINNIALVQEPPWVYTMLL